MSLRNSNPKSTARGFPNSNSKSNARRRALRPRLELGSPCSELSCTRGGGAFQDLHRARQPGSRLTGMGAPVAAYFAARMLKLLLARPTNHARSQPAPPGWGAHFQDGHEAVLYRPRPERTGPLPGAGRPRCQSVELRLRKTQLEVPQ